MAKTVPPRVDVVQHGVETSAWGFVEPASPGERKTPTPDQQNVNILQLQQAPGGDENIGFVARYIPARPEHLILGWVEPAPPTEDNIP